MVLKLYEDTSTITNTINTQTSLRPSQAQASAVAEVCGKRLPRDSAMAGLAPPPRRRQWSQEFWAATRKRHRTPAGSSAAEEHAAVRALQAEVASLRDFTYVLVDRIAALEATMERQMTEAAVSQTLPKAGLAASPRLARRSTVSMHGSSAFSRSSSSEGEACSA